MSTVPSAQEYPLHVALARHPDAENGAQFPLQATVGVTEVGADWACRRALDGADGAAPTE